MDSKRRDISSKQIAMMIMRVTDMAEKRPSFFTVNTIAGAKKHINRKSIKIKRTPPKGFS